MLHEFPNQKWDTYLIHSTKVLSNTYSGPGFSFFFYFPFLSSPLERKISIFMKKKFRLFGRKILVEENNFVLVVLKSQY